MFRHFLVFIFFYCASQTLCAQTNPLYFDLNCEHFKIFRDKSNDHIDLFLYDLETKQYEWFQNLSQYAQKFDYHSEGIDLHFISVTDESGHMRVYKWRKGEFYIWG